MRDRSPPRRSHACDPRAPPVSVNATRARKSGRPDARGHAGRADAAPDQDRYRVVSIPRDGHPVSPHRRSTCPVSPGARRDGPRGPAVASSALSRCRAESARATASSGVNRSSSGSPIGMVGPRPTLRRPAGGMTADWPASVVDTVRSTDPTQCRVPTPPGHASGECRGDHGERPRLPELYRELWLESKRLSATETWDGSLPLRLPSGRRLDIEFHARRDGTAQRFEVACAACPIATAPTT
jgi:hypothetical protein